MVSLTGCAVLVLVEVWDVAAHYLACLCVNMILMVSPEKIVLSGGVLLRACLFPKVAEPLAPQRP